jgi:hypothetical protein
MSDTQTHSTPDLLHQDRSDLQKELLRRSDLDQVSRSALLAGNYDYYARLIEIDDENAAWLEKVVDTVGWPGCSLVGEAGAHAAWLLAQHADRRPSFQQRCQRLMEQAVAHDDASPADLAYLTDRVLLAQGKEQIYGTQIVARDGRYVASRLSDSANVDQRRASLGLEPLGSYLQEALERYGTPLPARVPCTSCKQEIEVWLPEIGGCQTFECPSCGFAGRIRAYFPGI